MDINYLLFLQNFRNSINDAWTPFMDWISHFAVAYLMLIPAFLYWCVDKKKGLYTLTSAVACIAAGAVVKLTFCIYRPWIRDSRIVTGGNAIKEATGYSFPSGHTTAATPMYGGIAATFGKKRKWIAAVCILLILITGFSRNYLGVHTPQDVIVGFLLSALIMFGVARLFRHLEAHPEKEDAWLLAGLILTAAALLYIFFKPYPMDYVDGKLLVDPETMKIDGYKDVATLGSFCIGRFIEKHFIRFREAGLKVGGILVSMLGAVPLFVINKILPGPVKAVVGPRVSGVVIQALVIFFIIAIWPAVIRLATGKAGSGSEVHA